MATYTTTFIADSSGESITFYGPAAGGSLVVDNVSLREVTTAAVTETHSIKEFLSGATDEGEAIFFRADTNPIQLNAQFEIFSNPISLVTRIQRGTLTKCFVALDDGDFYEIQGTVKKGVSTLKIHSRDIKSIPTPPIAREVKVSWRDSSKQLCRLIQTAIVFIPGAMDTSE
jgi:hypothetical protein